jgi:hypothetical protein
VARGAALATVALKWRETPARLILTYARGIGAFYGIIPLVPLLLGERLGITEDTVTQDTVFAPGTAG